MEHIIELSCGQAEFPDVIVWDSRNSDYRTPSRNTFFDIIDRFTAGCINETEEKPFDFSSVESGADGETRTRTG